MTETAPILEVALLSVKPGQAAAYERALAQALPIIAASPGCLGVQVQRCLETKGRYILLVNWRTLEDHTVGFRQSPAFHEWRRLLHDFYDPKPVVEHYELVAQQ